ncbi:hypothetical protein BFJ63_vAg19879 [Fusarium oxysporum f. sp. narcissi]|uniref:Tc1-like transposase DDE domain-containing protein n=5 Tax=Fusarium oxysporum TaxID=5507 RepID=A0A2H3TV09_FUSOX|nr:Transposable element Tcb1 transposase [Fusarium oxysporum f. sp. raphani]KAK2468018.1 hypothetical protein H9L39_20240 [Fusarium oxysporum f. sp. albedinis]QOE88868.1 transposase [Fusarium oxysporum f. sp. apii]RKK10796.1 hypothetical protein BFJ65_g14792 [Fusarium oxysporum f. sp. cepae]RKK75012.1 hypothetical protein BFJ71_g17190 [Fusarium oxysporum]RYC77247.1 hypothetical protein BFJ63_vAg19879 [Fusarium oxysporum f. sp. narcissi]
MSTLGWIRRYRGKRPKTSPLIRQGRIDMCRRLLARYPLPEDWSEGNIIWTDEKTFYDVFVGRKGVTVRRDELIRDYRRTRRHGRGKNFWGSFCGSVMGPGFLFPVGSNNNARRYADGPLELIRHFYRQLQTEYGRNIDIMQDNSSVHNSGLVQDLARQWGLPLISWAAWSPDLNPIENLWSIMEGWMEDNYNIEALNEDGQNEAIVAAKDAMPADLLKSLSLSARDRLQLCIEKEGWPLDY